MQINAAIKKLREALGQSQQVFSNRLGVSLRGLANYETDRVPSLMVLARLNVLAQSANVAKSVKSAIARQYRQQLFDEVSRHGEGVVSFAFTEDETEQAGTIFEILLAPEEYPYAVAFQQALKEFRTGNNQARSALIALFRAASRFAPAQLGHLAQFIPGEKT